jgi:hypothetical protein
MSALEGACRSLYQEEGEGPHDERDFTNIEGSMAEVEATMVSKKYLSVWEPPKFLGVDGTVQGE